MGRLQLLVKALLCIGRCRLESWRYHDVLHVRRHKVPMQHAPAVTFRHPLGFCVGCVLAFSARHTHHSMWLLDKKSIAHGNCRDSLRLMLMQRRCRDAQAFTAYIRHPYRACPAGSCMSCQRHSLCMQAVLRHARYNKSSHARYNMSSQCAQNKRLLMFCLPQEHWVVI